MANETPASLPMRIVGFIEASSAMAEKAASAEQAQVEMQKEAAALIPGIVEILGEIKDGDGVPLIGPGEKSACAESLADHVRTLDILTKVAAHFKKQQADILGKGVPEARTKRAAAGDGPYTGRRGTPESPSWQQFRNAIMGG
jgi:hypothetical protein